MKYYLFREINVSTKQFIRKMRITCFLLFVLASGLFATPGNSQVAKVSINLKNEAVVKVLDAIESQTDYLFVYSKNEVDLTRKISIEAEKLAVAEVLTNVFDKTNIVYAMEGTNIMLMERSNAQQQGKKITGKVTEVSGGSLPGVSVVVKGTTTGVTTDNSGNYSLNVPENSTLQFSFIGMKTQDVVIGSKTVYNIVLSEETINLEEVIAVGYGIQKKASLTGAISSVKSADLIVTKNENITNMLAGKMAGVRIVQRTGEPGEYASSIQIRGFGTPLVIIDGVPRDNMSKLNPNEIESISVLKDASAAIYGVRAANGVILITTKKGAKGAMQLEYSGYYGVQTPINTPKGLDAVQYMEITNENNIMRGSLAPGTLMFKQSEIDAYKNGSKTGTEWSRINSNYYAPQYQHNISATGNSGMIDYFVNFSNFAQEGIYKTGDLNYERFNIRSNVTARINKNLKVEFLLSGMADSKNSPYGSTTNTQQYWRMVWVLPPTTPAFANYNRDYPQSVLMGNSPVVMGNSDIVGYDRNKQKLVQATGNLIWDIPWIKGLQAKGSYSYDYTFWENKSLQKPYKLYDYNLTDDAYVPANIGNTVMPGTSALTRSTRFSDNKLLQASLSYNRDFADMHHVAALLLYEEGTTNMDNLAASRYITMTSIEELLGGVDLNQKGYMDGSGFNSGAQPANQSGFWVIANKALVGRLNYDFNSKYYGEFSFRYDGSSKFAEGHQWGFFPSTSLGWRISEEPFIKNNSKLSFIQNLKLRASYGISGDDRTATFQYVPGYTYPTQSFIWPVRMFGDSKAAGISLKDTPNAKLTWMTSKLYDIGMDADLWKGLLGFELDVYKRDREGLVASRVVTLPDWLGEGLAQENLNSDATYGFDLNLKHRNIINSSVGKIVYGISANVGVTRTKNVYVERKPSVDQYDNWRNNPTNRPTDIWWGYGSDGQFQNYDEIFSHAILDNKSNAYMKPGDYKLEDWNGDGVVDSWDIHPITSGANAQNTPRIFFGSILDVQFRGFDVTAVFQGGALTTVKQSDFLSNPFYFDMNGPDMFYDRWHMKDPLSDPKNPRTEWIAGTYPTTSQSSPSMGINFGANTSTIKRADYVRLKSIELGYTIPKAVIDRIGIKGVRVYCTAYNLFTLTKLKYLDPEHPSSNNDLLYPLIRTVNFGGSINF